MKIIYSFLKKDIIRLQDLTPEQCVQIATIAHPEVDWKFTVCESNPWEGFDLIEKGSENLTSHYIFQIGYGDKYANRRFTFFEDLHEFSLNSEQILCIEKYINSLG